MARKADCRYSTGRLFQQSKWDAQSLRGPTPEERETNQSIKEKQTSESELYLNTEAPNSLASSPFPNRMRELQLMHHWCMKTCYSFSSSLSLVFQSYVVDQALCYPFLMDSLLALTSLHIANDLISADTNDSEERTGDGSISISARDCITDALRYQNQAAPAFRAALDHISPSNCNALFACSVIMMACAVVSSIHQDRDGNGGTSNLRSLLPFIKGVHSVIDKARPWLASGPFNGVILTHPDEDWLSTPQNDEALPTGLQELRRLQCSDASDVYGRAITTLRNCFIRDKAMAIPWLVVVGEEFIRLVQEAEPMALLVYTCWGVLLSHLDGIWWAKSSGRRIVVELAPSLDGAQEWADIASWAKEEVGFEAVR